MQNRLIGLAIVLISVCGLCTPAWSLDSVEFMSGAKMEGTVKEIRKTAKEFDFEAEVGARTSVRTYPFAKVHAVTFNGKRFVLTPKPDAASVAGSGDANSVQRSEAEVKQLIQTEGATLPDWFDATPLEYPKTLDLSWPLKPPKKGWNNKVNIGQYLWDVINPNTGRWHKGIKLVHHCQSLHKGNVTLLSRDHSTLGRLFFDLMQDYPRAAYWMQKGQGRDSNMKREHVMLAECYWRMGNRQMALKFLGGGSQDAFTSLAAIKLLGDMGETKRAVAMADRLSNTGVSNQAFLAAGDALRQADQLDDAVAYYSKVVNGQGFRNAEYEKRFKARARESIDAIRLFDQADPTKAKDGTHSGSSTGYNGKLEVAVKVADGKILSVKVTKHKEKQFYSALTDTEASILRLQTVRGIDGTSGATITSQAIVNATARALAGASQ
ncbi:FMN-binding protein [Planctomycetes bacterium K23_9]|uniref:Electron transport complex subunit RsxG n=1 Tax=Stieleria marina TaxID=1930275 RepID=A0A517P2T1_9BACT|nr:Electron transport complex subunit RsxG [Planctomycetes bacterium K23_9]